MKTTYAGLWIAWVAAFLIIELSALAINPRFILSDFVWRLEEINRAWTFLRFLVAAFCVWLAGHLVLGWWR